MASLDELLAKLPDNTTGAIDAADLREVVTGLWEYTGTVQASLSDVVVTGLPAAQEAIGGLDERVTTLEAQHAGHVDSGGSLVSGPDGWTATRDETGLYTVTHNLGVDPERYAVTVTAMILDTQTPVTTAITATSADSFTYRISTTDGENVNHDANFTGQVT